MANAEQKDPKVEVETRGGMTLADVLKMVKRPVPKIDKETKKPLRDKNKAIIMVDQAITEKEVMNWAVYDDKVGVVTTDGHKFYAER